MNAVFPFRLLFAAVWLVNGLWCKVLAGVPRHGEIVARILGETHAPLLARLIGAGEAVFALWILSGVRWKWSCALQIAAVAVMNVIELLLAPDLLLFGRFNALVALSYMAVVAWAGFGIRRTPA